MEFDRFINLMFSEIVFLFFFAIFTEIFITKASDLILNFILILNLYRTVKSDGMNHTFWH